MKCVRGTPRQTDGVAKTTECRAQSSPFPISLPPPFLHRHATPRHPAARDLAVKRHRASRETPAAWRGGRARTVGIEEGVEVALGRRHRARGPQRRQAARGGIPKAAQQGGSRALLVAVDDLHGAGRAGQGRAGRTSGNFVNLSAFLPRSPPPPPLPQQHQWLRLEHVRPGAGNEETGGEKAKMRWRQGEGTDLDDDAVEDGGGGLLGASALFGAALPFNVKACRPATLVALHDDGGLGHVGA